MRAKKVDANQSAVVDELRNAGCVVQSLAALGSGVPDLLVLGPREEYWNGRWAPAGAGYSSNTRRRVFLFEIKHPKRRKRLTKAQVVFHAEWRGAVTVVTNADEALDVIGAGIEPDTLRKRGAI